MRKRGIMAGIRKATEEGGEGIAKVKKGEGGKDTKREGKEAILQREDILEKKENLHQSQIGILSLEKSTMPKIM